jgi:hypothetical protein
MRPVKDEAVDLAEDIRELSREDTQECGVVHLWTDETKWVRGHSRLWVRPTPR